MSTEKVGVVTLMEAAQRLGSGDQEHVIAVRNAAKNAGALIQVNRKLRCVDFEVLVAHMKNKARAQVEKDKKRREAHTNVPQVGILKARARMYAGWIEGKKQAVSVASETLAQVKTPYAKQKAQKELARLEADLARMVANQKKDQAALDSIMDGDLVVPNTGLESDEQ